MKKEFLYLKKLSLIAILIAISFVLSKWQIPFIPPYTFLKFDLSETPIILSVLIYPELTIITVITYSAAIFMIHNPIGAIFKSLAVASFILTTGLIKLSTKNLKFSNLIALSLGLLARILIMVLLNYYMLEVRKIWPGFSMPWFYYVLIIPIFNLIQGGLNALLAHITFVKLKQIGTDI